MKNETVHVERRFSMLSSDERFQKRQEVSKPFVEALFAWADSAKDVPKTVSGTVVHYTIS